MAEVKKVAHIIPVGFTKPTLIESMKNYPFHRVYLVLGKEKTTTELWARKLADEIAGDVAGVAEVLRIETSFDDIYSSAADIIRIIKKEKEAGNEVMLNISGSMRSVAIACYLAASLCDVRAYIGLPAYDSSGNVVGITKVVEVPNFPIRELNGEKLEILKILFEKKQLSSIDELISILKPEIFKARGSRDYLKERSRISYHLKELEKGNFIKTEKKGKRKVLELTELGYLYALAKR